MVVVGDQSVIFDETGLNCTVNSFTESTGALKDIPIVDAALAYECPYQAKTFILLIRNALHIREMEYNLIPPFIIREAGIKINECPKYQSESPSIEDHSMWMESANLRIPFKLNGMFSYFETRKPTIDELRECDKVFITPDSTGWNPYNEAFSENENSMTDVWGELSTFTPRPNQLIEDSSDDTFVSISAVDVYIDSVIESAIENNVDHPYVDDVCTPMRTACAISSKLHDDAIIGKISIAMGVKNKIISHTDELFVESVTENNYYLSQVSSVEAGQVK